jgi:hypothetical protein
MKADEIFQASVEVMKRLLTPERVTEAIKRSRDRDAQANVQLLETARERINELVRTVLATEDPDSVIQQASQELIDAMVLRYLRNRDVFMKTFPDGIDEVDPDPAALWGAIMISPEDEDPNPE